MNRKEQLMKMYLDNAITIEELTDMIVKLEDFERQVVEEIKDRESLANSNVQHSSTAEESDIYEAIQDELNDLLKDINDYSKKTNSI